ncbi:MULTISPECIES: DUF5324 family protein [Streptomyces]|uniref:DUF5324 family protein n=1 Tax=Streptomyces TaxID=1883 RepID=UPI00135A5C41|nr:DUF5324 family protein [Streptomyces sp. NHF165]
MTRMDSVRAATCTAKDSVRHAAEKAAPHAGNAKDTAARYALEAQARLGPKVSKAARQARWSAREGYDQYLGPRVERAREALPAEVDRAASRAAHEARRAAERAAAYAGPRLESAVEDVRAAAGPAREEAGRRGAAAVAALRGEVTVEEIEKLARRRRRRARTGRFVLRMGLAGLLAGGAYAAWRWWDRQANPDWLVEPPPATEVGDPSRLTSVNGSAADTAAAEAGRPDPAANAPAPAGSEDDTAVLGTDAHAEQAGAEAEKRREK